MLVVFACRCGTLLRGRDDDELVTAVARHMATDHRMTLSRDQILALAQRVDTGDARRPDPPPDERQTNDNLAPTHRSYGRVDPRANGSRDATTTRRDPHEHGDG